MELFISYNGKITGYGMSISQVLNTDKVSQEIIMGIQETLRKEMGDSTIIILNWKRFDK